MDYVSEELKYLQKRFRRLYRTSDYYAKGGVFNRKKRQQLLGLYGKSGRDRKKYDFWQDVRDYVRTGLVDLQLFTETSDDKDVDMVLNRETLKPVIRSLLFPYSIQEPPKQGAEKAKIAQLLIEIGFEYLKKSTIQVTTSSQERMVEDAIDLSRQLTALLLPENERAELLRSGRM